MPLDHAAYSSILLINRPIPWPSWACQAPDGGVHISNKAGRIDVDLAKPPHHRAELHWTCDFGVHLVASSWLDEISDLIDQDRVFLGDVRVAGEKIHGWSTIYEPSPPALLASRGIGEICPICGDYYTTLWGSLFIGDQSAAGRPCFVNRKGIFIREDIVLDRNVRKPAGVFKPWIVELERR